MMTGAAEDTLQQKTEGGPFHSDREAAAPAASGSPAEASAAPASRPAPGRFRGPRGARGVFGARDPADRGPIHATLPSMTTFIGQYILGLEYAGVR